MVKTNIYLDKKENDDDFLKRLSEENKKPDLLQDLKIDIILKSKNAFNKSCDEMKIFGDIKKANHQKVTDIIRQHRLIVDAYEQSLRDFFYN